MQRIPGPQIIGVLGLEPAEHRWGRPGGGAGQAEPMKVALQGAFIRRPAQLGAQDALNRRRGALRVLPPQRHRQLQHLGRGARGALTRAGYQRVEPAGSPVADPPVDGLPADAHRRPNGSVCSREASSRTIFPRSLAECAASAASRIT